MDFGGEMFLNWFLDVAISEVKFVPMYSFVKSLAYLSCVNSASKEYCEASALSKVDKSQSTQNMGTFMSHLFQ